jgi:hypothetical protein
MARDERPDEQQEEHEFLAGLKARTGRDLAEWMAAIAAHGFHDKNEIIDWLRSEGLPFARASWLERIYRNGGKPIHGDVPVSALTPEAARLSVSDAAKGPAEPRRPPAPRPTVPPRSEPEARPSADAAQELEKLVSAAKGYRPLYHLLESQIRQAIPNATFSARGRYVSVAAPAELAAITLHPTEIRLGLDLGDRPFDAEVQKAKLRGPGPAITHMVLLTDARQVSGELLALVKAANQRVNGAGQ